MLLLCINRKQKLSKRKYLLAVTFVEPQENKKSWEIDDFTFLIFFFHNRNDKLFHFIQQKIKRFMG